MGINKVQYGNTTLIDLTADTVTADKLMQGYTAHDRSGALITGTATGGSGDGYVWQDENGYVHLSDEQGTSVTVEALSVTQNGTYTAPTGKAYSPVSVNVSGGGGLVYETGTWTPSEDVASYVIPFSNTHTEAPFYYTITDVTGTYDSTSDTGILVSYSNSHQLFGESFYISTTSSLYGWAYMRYRSTNATSSSQYNVVITKPYTSTDDSSVDCSRYWAKENGIKAYASALNRYFRSGRTYKWIAVWAPTT